MPLWIEEIKEKNSNYIKLLVIGNKIDLNEQRVISTEETKYRYKDIYTPVIETLALNGKIYFIFISLYNKI